MSRVIQVYSEPWALTPPPNKKSNIFDRMRAIAEDEEWRKTFEDASKGVFRNGFRYDEKQKQLIYVIKGRIRHNKVTLSDDPAKAILQCQKFMRNMAGVRTEIECTREKIALPTKTSEWDKIKKNELSRNFHLARYGIKLAESMGFDAQKRRELIHRLKVLVMSPKFDHKRVIFNNFRIQQIDGLVIDRNGRPTEKLTKTEGKYEAVVYQRDENEGIDYSYSWNVYLKKNHVFSPGVDKTESQDTPSSES